MNHIQQNPVVLTPQRSYSQYVFDNSNRDIKEHRIRRLAESIDTLYLLDLYPIVTSTEKVILDGQHRFSVAREMLLPFYALSGDDISIEDIAQANASTFSYDTQDALHLYANMEVPSYQYLRTFQERNPHLVASVSAQLLDIGCTTASFIEGLFAIRRPGYADVVAQRILDFMEIHKWVAKSAYRDAIANLTLNPVYDHGRMMDRLRAVPTQLLRTRRADEAFPILTQIYNYNIVRTRHVILKHVVGDQARNLFDANSDVSIKGMKLPTRGIVHQRQVEVQQTRNLHMFKAHPSARPIRPRRLKSLLDSMGRHNLLPYYPILVDTNQVILDGQLRWLAACELKVPISYIVTNNFSLRMATLASGRSTRWRLEDYLKHFSSRGYTDYLRIQEFCQKFRFIALSTAIMLLGRIIDRDEMIEFKIGRFVVHNISLAQRVAHLLVRIEDSKIKSSDIFQQDLFMLIRDTNLDGDLFVKQLNRYPQVMGPYNDLKSCSVQIANVYNYRQTQGKRILIRREYIPGTSNKTTQTVPMLTLVDEEPLTSEVAIVQ